MPGSAILITYGRSDAVDEAVSLCRAAGYRVDSIIRQEYLDRPKYGIGEETVRRLEDSARRLEPDVIVYDEVLRPSQNYNLASRLRRNILDRESLILEIFEGRASSAESKLQVRLGKMRYEMARAREKVRLSKMGEQPGFMGIGKFEADAYRDDIRHRMQAVSRKLAKAGKQRELHRQSRARQGFRTVSLAGYTSAGKTTLFNALTGESRPESPGLFTTLSTTMRRLRAGGETFLLSDTVGFISGLPAYMVDAFRSTLEELVHSAAVVVVIDVSDPPELLRKKFRSCSRTLGSLGVEKGRLVYALNKSDITGAGEALERAADLGIEGGVPVSARSGRVEGLAGQIAGAAGPGEAGWK